MPRRPAQTAQLMADYPKGSSPPADYVGWHDWAKAQFAHGLRQKQCPRCGLFKYPQEMANHVDLNDTPCFQFNGGGSGG